MKYLLTGYESERLKFRPLELADYDWWMGFCENQQATCYFDFSGNISSKQFCDLWFEKVFDRYKNDTGGHNVLIEKTTGKPVGMCGILIQEVDGVKEFEIGYSLHPGFWGRGFATEAAQTCRDFAFNNQFTNSLISIIHTENIPSARVAIQNGMIFDRKTVFKEIKVNIYRIKKSNH